MNGNPFYVHPGGDMTQGLQALGQTVQGIGERKRETEVAKRAVEKFATMKAGALEAFQSGDPNRIAEFALSNPEMGQALTESASFRNEQTKENYVNSLFSAIQSPDKIPEIVEARQKMLRSQGVESDSSQETDNFMDKYNADPEGTIKSLEAELAFMAPDRWKKYAEATGRDTGGEKGDSVASSEILEDGTTIQSMRNGGTVVYDSEGNKLTGAARTDAIQIGRAEKVANLRAAAGAKKTATLEAEQSLKGIVEAGVISQKAAAKISTEAFDKLEGINTNIANIDEGVRLIDEGAETGPVMAMLPSIRQTAIKLDNLQGRLGLDVLRSTTFGALSAAELKFALSTALPQGLEGPELKEWLLKKKASQEKLADYLEASAIYLGTPGNTVAGWVEKQRNARELKESQANAYSEGQTATGADGTKMVFRGGSWEVM